MNNLLPDNPAVRKSWASQLDVPNTGFDLLSKLGEDIAGALVLLPEGRKYQDTDKVANFATEDAIVARVAELGYNPSAWADSNQLKQARMSLAGAQGKFSLTRIKNRWAYPTYASPSTHIHKPPSNRYPEAPALEAGSLQLARTIGIAAPCASITTFLDQPTYIVERFDRDTSNGVIRRIHIEDFAQAMSRHPDAKYQISASNVLSLLEKYNPPERYKFIEQLAFNTMIGNTDAHGKNYSVFLAKTIRLAPLYDSLPTIFWPELNTKLAMKIGPVPRSQEMTIAHWSKFATKHDLDVEHVLEIISRVRTGILENWSQAYEEHGATSNVLNRLERIIVSNTKL